MDWYSKMKLMTAIIPVLIPAKTRLQNTNIQQINNITYITILCTILKIITNVITIIFIIIKKTT